MRLFLPYLLFVPMSGVLLLPAMYLGRKAEIFFAGEDIDMVLVKHKSCAKIDREFWLDGRLYDILEIKSSGDSVFYYCHHDKREEQLSRMLSGFVEDQEQNESNWIDIFKIQFFLSSLHLVDGRGVFLNNRHRTEYRCWWPIIYLKSIGKPPSLI